MQVQGEEVTSRKVTIRIDAKTILEQMEANFKHHTGVRTDSYLSSDGKLVYLEDWCGRGSSSEVVVDANPSEHVVTVLRAFELVKSEVIKVERSRT